MTDIDGDRDVADAHDIKWLDEPIKALCVGKDVYEAYWDNEIRKM